ncbi:protein of unknown function [Paraburkholderia kururiensis]
MGRLASIEINGGRAADAFCMSQCTARRGHSTRVHESSTIRETGLVFTAANKGGPSRGQSIKHARTCCLTKGLNFDADRRVPIAKGGVVNRATTLFSWLGRGIFGLLSIVLLLATAAAGPGVDLPTSKRGWFALAAIIAGGVLICIVVVRSMHTPVTLQR